MKREEAIAVLKEVVEACKTAGYSHISLKAVEESEGFKLHIKDHFDEKDFKRIADIIQKRNLNMKKYDGSIVIYAPKHI